MRPLFRIPFEPDGFTVPGWTVAKDDAVRISVHPCIRMSGVGPGFARQAQPEAGLKDVPVEGGQPHPFHIDRRGGM